jgi:predicted nucleic acid-binding protein
VAERPVVNASPLIFLSKGGLLELLRLAVDEIVVPLPVASEIDQRGAADITAQAISKTSWLVVTETSPPRLWCIRQREHIICG